MSDREFELKPISKRGISAALKKAERYRLLGDPSEAESICRDVLRIDSKHQAATITYVLSLTDQFPMGVGGHMAKATELIGAIKGTYEKAYYTGVIHERSAKAAYGRLSPHKGLMAYNLLRDAMEQYEKADALSEATNDDAVIRWNGCARMINDHYDICADPIDIEPPQLLE